MFDFDDTLVETTVYFDRAKDEFARLMTEQDLADADMLATLNRYDIAEVEACGGFHKECFPRALVNTYREYCRRRNRVVDAGVARVVEELGWEVFRQTPSPLPGAEKLLRSLTGHSTLILVTRGDPVLQKARLDASGLAGYFTGVHVLPAKDEAVYRRIAGEHRLQPERSWMVGNSMRSDINPARRAGFRCIYIQHPRTWDYDMEEPVGGHLEVRSLDEVGRLIAG
ncbi:MAG TPA: HAD family hydrolase [Spirochaetia bacterium]|nr:HAD family hydrolase [Spirochaetia bacterium]